MLKFFESVCRRPVLFALMYGLAIAVPTMIVSVSSSIAYDNVKSFAFVGPFAIFLTLASILFILIPRVFLQNIFVRNLKRMHYNMNEKLIKVLFSLETLVFLFMLFGYMSSLSGTSLGGLGLLMLIVFNIIGLVFAGIGVMFTVIADKTKDEVTKARVQLIS